MKKEKMNTLYTISLTSALGFGTYYLIDGQYHVGALYFIVGSYLLMIESLNKNIKKLKQDFQKGWEKGYDAAKMQKESTTCQKHACECIVFKYPQSFIPEGAELQYSILELGCLIENTRLTCFYRFNTKLIIIEVINEFMILPKLLAEKIKDSEAIHKTIYTSSSEVKAIAELREYGLYLEPVVYVSELEKLKRGEG